MLSCLLLLASLGQAPAVTIDDAWLAKSSPPYVLSQAGATYTLAADMRVDRTAFVVVARDVTLDLAGHSVTFGDGPAVPELTFSANPPPSGKQGPWSATSDPVALPEARTYVCCVWPHAMDYRTLVKVSVLDDSGAVLASNGTAAAPNGPAADRGFAVPVTFAPKAAGNVTVRVDVTMPQGGTDLVTLDMQSIRPGYDRAVVCARMWAGQLPGIADWSDAAKAAYGHGIPSRLTIKNGKLLQGKAGAYNPQAVYAAQCDGLTLQGVETSLWGDDPHTIDLLHAGLNPSNPAAPDPLAFRDCTFREGTSADHPDGARTSQVTNRMRDYATVYAAAILPPLEVSGCKLLGSPQEGIFLDGNGPNSTVAIRGNTFAGDSVAADPYAIVLSACHDVEVSKNTITPASGRGIDLDGFRATPCQHIRIADNAVRVSEHPNRETPGGMGVWGLRLRNIAPGYGPHKDVQITGNTVEVVAGPGNKFAAALEITYSSKGGQAGKDVTISGNTFRGLAGPAAQDGRPRPIGIAVLIDGMDAGTGPVFTSNVLESDNVCLQFGGINDPPDLGPFDLSGCTFRKLASADPTPPPWSAAHVGYYTETVSGIRILDPVADGFPALDGSVITWGGLPSVPRSLAVGVTVPPPPQPPPSMQFTSYSQQTPAPAPAAAPAAAPAR